MEDEGASVGAGLSFFFPALGFGGVLSARRIASSRRRSISSAVRCPLLFIAHSFNQKDVSAR